MYVRARQDFQEMRKRIDNRLGKKADQSEQNISDERYFSVEDYNNFRELRNNAEAQEKSIEKMLRNMLQQFSIYNDWLQPIKGVGEVAAGWLISEFDIEEAETVSKMWQYAGLNPGRIKGKKRVAKSSYKREMGQIVDKVKNIKTGEMDYIIQTDNAIRGDKATPGYLLPYNKNLKTHLLGVMAPGFVKTKNYYANTFYYPYKHRLENSSQLTNEIKKGGKVQKVKWKDATKGHRNQAALRYMIKMFIKDFYVVWRTMEDLPVRQPYQDEYLGHQHDSE